MSEKEHPASDSRPHLVRVRVRVRVRIKVVLELEVAVAHLVRRW